MEIAGIGVNCQCNQIEIVNTTFSNLTALSGGALYLEANTYYQSEALLETQQQGVLRRRLQDDENFISSEFIIESSEFSGNTAFSGGAIYIDGVDDAYLVSNQF